MIGAGQAQQVSRRGALISAAITLFAERPYRDVSIDEIVAAAGVAHGMVSYHFGGKQGLFLATVSFIWDDLTAFEERRLDEVQAAAAVRGFVRRHLDYVSRYPQRFAILSRAAQDDTEVRRLLDEAKVAHFARLLSVIGCRSQFASGLMPVLRGWSAFVDQLTLDWTRGAVPDADEVAELCLQVLVASIAAVDGFRFDRHTRDRALSRVADTLHSRSG